MLFSKFLTLVTHSGHMCKTGQILHSCLKRSSLKACICGNSCIYTRREQFLPAGSSQQSSLQPCQPFVEEEWRLPAGCQADSPCCFQSLCGDAAAAPGEQEGGWEPNRSLMIVPDMCQSFPESLGLHDFHGFQTLAVPPDYRKCA